MINPMKQCVEITCLAVMHHLGKGYKACPSLDDIRDKKGIANIADGLEFELLMVGSSRIKLIFSDLLVKPQDSDLLSLSIELDYDTLCLMWPSQATYNLFR